MLAKDPEEFQQKLDTYLAPLLLKFASKDDAVRKQIMSTTKMLLSKISSFPEIKVPINALLDQVQNPKLPAGADDGTSVQIYSLLFIGKGIPRLDQSEKAELFSKIWKNISLHKVSIAARLFNIGLTLLNSFDTENFPAFPVFENQQDVDFLYRKFYQFMLLFPTKLADNGMIASDSSQQGLSSSDVSFFYYLAGAVFNASQLSGYKYKLLKYLEKYENPQKALVLICATADGDPQVSSFALASLKRASVDYESSYLIERLISLFIGKEAPPVKSTLSEKIISILSKSKLAAHSKYVDQIAIIGMNSSNNKLKQATVSFVRWFTTVISSSASDDFDAEVSAKISEQLKLNLSSIDEHPPNFKVYLTQRQTQYETLGLLMKKIPGLVNLGYVSFFFHMITIEDPSLRSTIQVSLTNLGPEISRFQQADKDKLFELLKSNIETKSSDSMLKFSSVKLMNSVFPFGDVQCRLLNIIALNGNSSHDNLTLSEEVSRGLHPYWFKVLNNDATEIVFPDFKILVSSIIQNIESLDNRCIQLACKFAWNCLVMNSINGNERAQQIITPDQHWEAKVDSGIEFDDIVHNCMVEYINGCGSQISDNEGDISMEADRNETNSITDLIKLFTQFAIRTEFSLDSSKVIYKLLSLCNNSTLNDAISENTITLFLGASSSLYSAESMHYVAGVIAIIVTHPKTTDSFVRDLLLKLSSEKSPMNLLIWGFIVSRLQLRNRIEPIVSYKEINEHLLTITNALDSSSSIEVSCALDVVSQLSIFGCLSHDDPDMESIKQNLKVKIKKLVLTHNDLASHCWAYLALTFNDSSTDELNEFESLLLKMFNTKHDDYLFTVGECLSILSVGWDSNFMKRMNDIQAHPAPCINPGRTDVIFKEIMKLCFNNSPPVCKAGCIWLLSMTQFSYSGIMKEKAKEIQHAFMRFLSSKEDVLQEAATRGLSIVYENGDNELQDVLIHDLLSAFTDTNKTTKEILSEYVDHDTQLFDQGVMNTGNGQSVNTYKDVLNLASEIGDPTLVYKFMSLAKNSALWSSRKGMAFGLGAILDESKLNALMQSNSVMSKRLITKLWKFKHDPNPSVARTMNKIWDSLIIDPKSAINQNFDIIFRECISGMAHSEWRVREASTAALHDLLDHVEFNRFDSRLQEIWSMSFRAMDDIKSSVRTEGEKLTRFLANLMISKISNSTNVDSQVSILEQLVPFLFGNNGLLSDIEEVKNFAFETVMKLINTNSNSLKPFAPKMIIDLVSMMSSVEPQMINYIALNADKYNLKTTDIDSQRLGMVGSSTLMGAIEKLLGFLDSETLPGFIEGFNGCVKNAIGLPSKVAASKVIVDLIVKQLLLVSQYGDKLLKIASGQLKDKNDTVARSYAMACGYVTRCASVKATQSLSKKLLKYYFEKKAETGDDRYALISAYTCECVFMFSNDKFQSIASGFLPLTFIGKHDTAEQVSTCFKKVWTDSTSSSSNSIKLYMPEIISLMNKHIDSTNLELRKTIAFSIIELVNKLGVDIANIDSTKLSKLYQLILDSLKGRTYDGKEKLLHSLVLLSTNSKSYLKTNNELLKTVTDRIINEVNRNNAEYRKECTISFGLFLSAYPENEALYRIFIERVDSLMKENHCLDADDDVNMETGSSEAQPGIETILFRQKLINSVISSIVPQNVSTGALDYAITALLDHVSSIKIALIKTKDGKHRFKLGLLNLLRRIILLVYGDSDNCVIGIGCSTDINRENIFKIWSSVSKIVISADELQSILIPFVRLTDNLLRSGDFLAQDKTQFTEALVRIKTIVNNTVVITEINNRLAI